jgi:hypothetical protein
MVEMEKLEGKLKEYSHAVQIVSPVELVKYPDGQSMQDVLFDWLLNFPIGHASHPVFPSVAV